MRVWGHLRYEFQKCWWAFKPWVRKAFDDVLPGRPRIERLGRVSYRAKIEGHYKNICVRRGAYVREGAWLNCMDAGSRIEIGERTLVMPWAKLVASENGSIKIGRDCTVHSFNVLYGHSGGLQIGNNVRIAVNVSMISGNHGFDDPSRSPNDQGGTSKGIIIHDNVWIGAGVIILDGVEIGEGAVLGAGSVVTRNVRANSVCVGVPARAVRQRGENLTSQSI